MVWRSRSGVPARLWVSGQRKAVACLGCAFFESGCGLSLTKKRRSEEAFPLFNWSRRMKVRIAYIEEPPFYWTGSDGVPTGADLELADVVLRAIGVSSI